MSFNAVYDLKIFQGIEHHIIDEILEKCPRKFFEQGKNVMTEGDESNGKCYVIVKGSVSVIQNSQRIDELSGGDIFGEIALMNDEPRSATILPLSEIHTIELSQEDIFTIIENDENNLNKEIMRRMEENLER